MSIKVTTQPKNRISINTPQKAEILSVGVAGGSSGATQYLVQLKDVDAASVANNNTVVYDVASGKFKIEELPIVNGGTF